MNKIELMLNLGGYSYGTGIQSHYRTGDTASICDCITDFSDKTERFKENFRTIDESIRQGSSFRIRFYRQDNTIIDEVSIDIEDVEVIKTMINYFMYV